MLRESLVGIAIGGITYWGYKCLWQRCCGGGGWGLGFGAEAFGSAAMAHSEGPDQSTSFQLPLPPVGKASDPFILRFLPHEQNPNLMRVNYAELWFSIDEDPIIISGTDYEDYLNNLRKGVADAFNRYDPHRTRTLLIESFLSNDGLGVSPFAYLEGLKVLIMQAARIKGAQVRVRDSFEINALMRKMRGLGKRDTGQVLGLRFVPNAYNKRSPWLADLVLPDGTMVRVSGWNSERRAGPAFYADLAMKLRDVGERFPNIGGVYIEKFELPVEMSELLRRSILVNFYGRDPYGYEPGRTNTYVYFYDREAFRKLFPEREGE